MLARKRREVVSYGTLRRRISRTTFSPFLYDDRLMLPEVES